ncbi:tellurium resistance protein [Acinetobacter sp. ANC 4633]|uniref:VWA domain-containing protein n=1 Tax=Acinetobacter sp. ANC 4633 TaxID=2529845 RepID=UPI00103F4A46|nr:VWA domain-containing protein [Acinetobacter sp. ANC 4633]TCB24816.1 tellurium resistance protein [Acinetobacter sp. ANC 4633]
MELISGQKLPLKNLFEQQQFRLRIQFNTLHTLDLSCFALDQHDRLIHDDYMVFYNQPHSPQKEVCYSVSGAIHEFQINLAKTNPNIVSRLVFCAALENQQLSMHDIQSGVVELINSQSQVVASYRLLGSSFKQEKALLLLEVYFKNDAWRLAVIGQGFSGGLETLVKHFGAKVSTPVAPVVSGISAVDLRKKIILDKVQADAPHLLNLTKKSLISLEKNQLIGVRARVALVLDYSGSMLGQYRRGDVQKVLNRVMPLAVNFDDDANFECWAFAERPLRLSDVSLHNLPDFINCEQGGYKKWQAGACINNEPAVIQEVVQYFLKEQPDDLPVYIVFISDGGVGSATQIKRLLRENSNQPIFWQFIGIGGRGYGILEQLDTLTDRVVDNCNFFAIDHLQSLSESELYDLMLQEFPQWLEQAKAKQILN